ncbi:MAG: TIM barrel protein [Clostridia bacterium]|nr:TIM barrel protein [Clostridia bacterium]
MKLGGHCVLFGPAIASDTEGVINKLAFAGAEGCELGERFFPLEQRALLTGVLDRHHVALAGLHCNNLLLPDLIHAPEKARAALRKTAEFVSALPEKNVIASGGTGEAPDVLQQRTLEAGSSLPELHDPEQVRLLAKNLNAIVREIKRDFGVQVHYHNHSWEFADGGLIWLTMAEEAPDLCFALDTGWAAMSGYDPVDLMNRYPGRFRYVHLRDYAPCDQPTRQKFIDVHKGFISLGTGAMGYPRLMRKLHRELGENGWAIVEYEIGNFDENSYLKAISYLKGIRDML